MDQHAWSTRARADDESLEEVAPVSARCPDIASRQRPDAAHAQWATGFERRIRIESEAALEAARQALAHPCRRVQRERTVLPALYPPPDPRPAATDGPHEPAGQDGNE